MKQCTRVGHPRFVPVLLLTLVLPVKSVAAAGAAGTYVSWSAENFAIIEPLAALNGGPQRGTQLVADRRKGNCLACHQLPIKTV